ncbi:hypothetical protein [Devosia chinhatensis]|uniref:hypothetical protein n=1 Tax=Devosia chinhatensis TaxID=429727 RepID=UPI00128E02D4|nr:hypothetical protein [Devosia chinhatensis]
MTMRARLSLAMLSLALVAAPALAGDAPVEPVQCAGIFGPDSSESLLRDTFGDDNVVTGIVPGPEGTELLATTIFPDDPDRRMEFGWFDEQNLARLNYVELSPSQAGPQGVRIGMSVAEVEALNGQPFAVGGFWWDYGGYAIIDDGALAGVLEGGCYLSIRFAPAEDYPQDIDVTPVAGEVQVPSADPLLATLDTRVQVLTIGYPWPEDLPQPQY